MSAPTNDTGDVVSHGPTGERWIAAYVRGDRLAWAAWPEGEAALSDCTLVRKATHEEQQSMLQRMAIGTGARARYVRHRLGMDGAA